LPTMDEEKTQQVAELSDGVVTAHNSLHALLPADANAWKVGARREGNGGRGGGDARRQRGRTNAIHHRCVVLSVLSLLAVIDRVGSESLVARFCRNEKRRSIIHIDRKPGVRRRAPPLGPEQLLVRCALGDGGVDEKGWGGEREMHWEDAM